MNIQVSGTNSPEERVAIESYPMDQTVGDQSSLHELTMEFKMTEVSGTSVAVASSSSELPDIAPMTCQSGAVATQGEGMVFATWAVPVEVSREARPYLAGDLRKVLENLQSLVLTASNRSGVPVVRLEISLKYLRKDRRRNPFIWMEVTTGPEVHPNQALALWDAIGVDVDRWIPKLSPRVKRQFEDRISLSVSWVEPDAN